LAGDCFAITGVLLLAKQSQQKKIFFKITIIAEFKKLNLLAVAYFPQRVPPSVSSALGRFTSVFGMGTGGTTSL
jgi:hypothetical protein